MPAPLRAAERQLLVVGDSLSAEYGLARGQGWVALLGERLKTTPAGKGWSLVNASISGDTTSGGLSRLPGLLERHKPAITIIELGGNDALRGLSLTATDANLRKMVALARDAGSRPMLIGMQMPPNYGAAYAKQFSDLYRRIADAERIALVPFLLEGFGDDTDWFQPDRIHPAAKAQPRMLDNVWPVLEPLL
ncbi:MAG: arylesterase [Lautropia sp.]